MTEIEKCNAGLPYRFNDPEMIELKTAAIRECELFNSIDGTDYEAQYRQLQKMLGSVGERVWIAKNFNCDRGKNIHIGNYFTGNHNLTILDIREDGESSPFGRGKKGLLCLGKAGNNLRRCLDRRQCDYPSWRYYR